LCSLTGSNRFYCDILSKRRKFRHAFPKTNKKYEIIKDRRFDLSEIQNNPPNALNEIIRNFSTFAYLEDLTIVFRQ